MIDMPVHGGYPVGAGRPCGHRGLRDGSDEKSADGHSFDDAQGC